MYGCLWVCAEIMFKNFVKLGAASSVSTGVAPASAQCRSQQQKLPAAYQSKVYSPIEEDLPLSTPGNGSP